MRRPALLVGLILAALPIACKKSSGPAGPAATTTTAALADKSPTHDPSGLLAALRAPSQEKRSRAIHMAKEMDEQGNDPIPVLLEALKDSTCGPLGGVHADRPTSTRETAVKALLELQAKGKKALVETGLKTLEKGLSDRKPEVREHTINAIGMVRPEGRSSAEAIAKLCADSTKEVRAVAYRTLDLLKPVPPGPILKLLVHPDLQIASEAAAALTWLKPTGADAVPPLLDALKRETKPKQEASDVNYIRNSAAEALAGVGKGADTAVPALVELLAKTKKEDIEAMVRPQKATDTHANLSGPVLALRRIGRPAAEAVIPLLKHEQPVVRFQAAAVLSGMNPGEGSAGLEAVQAAMEAERTLPNGELYAFEEMVAATLNLGGDAESVLNQLTELLKSEQEIVRYRSAKALARLGRKAAPAAKKLTELLNDPVALIQYAALEALAAIGPAAKDSVIEIAKIVASEDVNLAREATRTLRAFGPAAGPAVPALAKALDANDASLSTEAAEALAAVGPEATAAVDAIAKHLGDSNSRREERLALLQAAAAIGPPAKEALPAITKLLGERETSVRVVAIETLAKVGPGNAEVVKSLAAPLGDVRNNPTVVQAAVLKALAGMGPAAKAAAGEVKGYVEKATDRGTKVLAAATLVALGTDADANAKVVLAALKDKAPTAKAARAAAVEATEFLGPHGKAAVPDLLDVLQDKAQAGPVREKAARSLGKLGVPAKDAIRPLTDALKDPDKGVRRAAAEALGLMGPDAVVAAPKLRDLIKTDRDVAEAAQAALERIEQKKKEP
jgi:HEAT repeat protein